MMDAIRWSFSPDENAEVGIRAAILFGMTQADRGDSYYLDINNQRGWVAENEVKYDMGAELQALGIDPTRPFTLNGKTFQYADGKITILDAGTGPSGLYTPLPGEG